MNISSSSSSSSSSLYHVETLEMKVYLYMREVGDRTMFNLQRKIVQKIEGKCIREGYVKPGSVKVVEFSAGFIETDRVNFRVVYLCLVCNPVEGQKLQCRVQDITLAGVHAVIYGSIPGKTMVEVFVPRDYNYSHPLFVEVRERMRIEVRVIGRRFELNDTSITVIAMLDSILQNETLQQQQQSQQSNYKKTSSLLAEIPGFESEAEEEAKKEEEEEEEERRRRAMMV